MFAFGSGTEDGFVFVQTSNGHVYTYPTEANAREYFGCVKTHSHLYQLDNDLGVARLVEQGDNLNPAPAEVEPTEEQKLALYSGYPYKSLLAWAPIPEAIDA
jgi:hypothetical protein